MMIPIAAFLYGQRFGAERQLKTWVMTFAVQGRPTDDWPMVISANLRGARA